LLQEHRYLLKHPVISSFLWFKWQLMRRYFNRNLRFYILFTFLLTWFIFGSWGGHSRARLTHLVWYGGFILLFTGMVAFILRDWIRNSPLCSGAKMLFLLRKNFNFHFKGPLKTRG
jgi:hypothetical protein